MKLTQLEKLHFTKVNELKLTEVQLLFNRLSKGGGYGVRLYTYSFNVCSPIFFQRMLQFWIFFVVGKISFLWWSGSKNFLNPHGVNLLVCLFNNLFDYNFRRKRTVIREFLYVFELHRFALRMKIAIVSYRNLFTAHYKNFIPLIFSVIFNYSNRHQILICF